MCEDELQIPKDPSKSMKHWEALPILMCLHCRQAVKDGD